MSILEQRNEIYTCGTCEMRFRFKSAQLHHVQTCSKTCKVCGEILISLAVRKDHEIRCAAKCTCNFEEIYKCGTCGRKFKFEILKVVHEKFCDKKCKYCMQLFIHFTDRTQHEKSCAAKPSQIHSCRNCDQIFLLHHERADHESTCRLTCKICKKVFSHQNTRAHHEKTCINMFTDCSSQLEHKYGCPATVKCANIYVCKLCKQSFPNQCEAFHEKTCKMICQICRKTFATSFSRSRHEKRCKPKQQPVSSKLANRRIRHPQKKIVKPHPSAEASNSDTKEVKSNQKETSSNECNAPKNTHGNSLVSNSTANMRKNHKNATIKLAIIYFCELCKHSFPNSCREFHEEDCTMICKICRKSFVTAYNRRRHEKDCIPKQWSVSSKPVESRLLHPQKIEILKPCSSVEISVSKTKEVKPNQKETLPSSTERNDPENTQSKSVVSDSTDNVISVTEKNEVSSQEQIVCKYCRLSFASSSNLSKHKNYCIRKPYLISSAACDKRSVQAQRKRTAQQNSSKKVGTGNKKKAEIPRKKSLPSVNHCNATSGTGSQQILKSCNAAKVTNNNLMLSSSTVNATLIVSRKRRLLPETLLPPTKLPKTLLPLAKRNQSSGLCHMFNLLGGTEVTSNETCKNGNVWQNVSNTVNCLKQPPSGAQNLPVGNPNIRTVKMRRTRFKNRLKHLALKVQATISSKNASECVDETISKSNSETDPQINCNGDKNVSVSENSDTLSSETGAEKDHLKIASVCDNSLPIETAVSGTTRSETAAKASNTTRCDVTPEELVFSFKTEDGSVCLNVISLKTDQNSCSTECNEELDKILPDPETDQKPLKIKIEQDAEPSQDVSGLSVGDYDLTKIIKMEASDNILS